MVEIKDKNLPFIGPFLEDSTFETAIMTSKQFEPILSAYQKKPIFFDNNSKLPNNNPEKEETRKNSQALLKEFFDEGLSHGQQISVAKRLLSNSFSSEHYLMRMLQHALHGKNIELLNLLCDQRLSSGLTAFQEFMFHFSETHEFDELLGEHCLFASKELKDVFMGSLPDENEKVLLKDDAGYSALYYAISGGHWQVLDRLIEQNPQYLEIVDPIHFRGQTLCLF